MTHNTASQKSSKWWLQIICAESSLTFTSKVLTTNLWISKHSAQNIEWNNISFNHWKEFGMSNLLWDVLKFIYTFGKSGVCGWPRLGIWIQCESVTSQAFSYCWKIGGSFAASFKYPFTLTCKSESYNLWRSVLYFSGYQCLIWEISGLFFQLAHLGN